MLHNAKSKRIHKNAWLGCALFFDDLNDECVARISKDYYNNDKDKAIEEYLKFANKDLIEDAMQELASELEE